MKTIFRCFARAYSRHHFCTFSGTASREEFWYFVLTLFLLNSVLVALVTSFMAFSWQDLFQRFYAMELADEDSLWVSYGPLIAAGAGLLYFVFMLVSIIPATALAVRRYHEAGLSGMVFAVLALGSPFCAVLVMVRVWTMASGYSDMLLSDPDTLLEGSFTVEVMLMFLSQLLGYVNLLCLALPPKMENNVFA